MVLVRVLCVDDDRINILLLEQVCLAAGVREVEFAESGAEAGPWMLALCHAKYTGTETSPPSLSPASTRYGGAGVAY